MVWDAVECRSLFTPSFLEGSRNRSLEVLNVNDQHKLRFVIEGSPDPNKGK